MEQKNNSLFQDIPVQLSGEIFDNLLQTKNFCLERIVSHGQSTPAGEWLVQEQEEWVVLISGAAILSFAQDLRKLKMQPGDYVNIPAYSQHRVEWTDPNIKTVWLALHYDKK